MGIKDFDMSASFSKSGFAFIPVTELSEYTMNIPCFALVKHIQDTL